MKKTQTHRHTHLHLHTGMRMTTAGTIASARRPRPRTSAQPRMRILLRLLKSRSLPSLSFGRDSPPQTPLGLTSVLCLDPSIYKSIRDYELARNPCQTTAAL
jgi:hypothetical protein